MIICCSILNLQGCKRELDIIIEAFHTTPLHFNFPNLRLTFEEASKLLTDNGIEHSPFEDFTTVDEKELGKIIKDKYNIDFYIIDRFPSCTRPFYTMPCDDDDRFTKSYDLFLRGEEICSGSQRIHDPELLTKQAIKHGINPDTISGYIDSFKYGSFPHAGAGLGLERIVMLLLGLDNIRMTSLFPRDPTRITP
jgi:aspartyl-tRNA synthetase